jgi:hypothetical protein
MRTTKANWFFNPFIQIAGWKAFGIGLGIAVIATIIGYFCKVCFPGALDIKYSPFITLGNAFLFQAIAIVSLVVVLYIAGLIFSKDVRFQDILGTVTLSRYPYLFATPLGLLMGGSDEIITRISENPLHIDPSDIMALTPTIFIGLFMGLFVIWFIVLLYNGFKVSTNLKGVKGGIVFTVSLFIAEIISLIPVFLFF